MKLLINFLISFMITFQVQLCYGQPEPIDSQYYYRLKLKTAEDRYLRIGWNGVTLGSTQTDSLSTWLFIPTETAGEYWIFNKGALGGRGQILTLPQGKSNFQQWEFTGADRQIFTLKPYDGAYGFICKYNDEAICTRWDDACFTNPWWEDQGRTDVDLSQLMVLERAELVSSADMLVSYLYWNIDNETIRNHILENLQPAPKPQLFRIKEIVIKNRSSKRIRPEVHHEGCSFTPWRAGLPKCWAEDFEVGQDTTYIVTPFLEHVSEAYAIMRATVAAGVLTIATLGAATPWSFGAVVLGTTIGSGSLLIYDVVDIGKRGFTSERAVDLYSMAAIKEECGECAVEVVGNQFKQVMKDWYIYERFTERAFDKMVFCGGKAIFVVTDHDIEGTWRADDWDGEWHYWQISKNGSAVKSNSWLPTGGSASSLSITNLTADSKIPNRYTDSANNSFSFTGDNSFIYKNADGTGKSNFSRVYDFEGVWQQGDENIFIKTASTTQHDGITITRSETISDWRTTNIEQRTYRRDSNYANLYTNLETGEQYIFTDRNNLLNQQGNNSINYYRVFVTFQSSNYPQRYVNNKSNFGMVDPWPTEISSPTSIREALSKQSTDDFFFELTPGLSRSNSDMESISITVVGGKEYFRDEFSERDGVTRIKLQQPDGSHEFGDDATFYLKPALDGKGGVSFESKSQLGHYLRHQGFALFVHENDDTPLFAGDASYKIITIGEQVKLTQK